MICNPKCNIITIYRLLLFAVGSILVFQFWYLHKYIEPFYEKLKISAGTIYNKLPNIPAKDLNNYSNIVAHNNLHKSTDVGIEIQSTSMRYYDA